MTKTDSQLTTAANIIQNETEAQANTQDRVGSFLNNMNDSKINIDKIDVDSAMTANSDALIPSQKAVKAAGAAKQDALVSGTNIKTVNGSSILGSGNLVIGTISYVKISVSSAEILALFTTPKTLVAAQGAGTFINVLSIAMRLNYLTAAYAINTTLRVEMGLFSPIITTNTIIATADNDFIVTSPTQSLEVSGTPDWINVPLKLKCLIGNPTGGSGTLDVYVTYNVISL